jgi:uracil-DNA glycosylase
VRNVTDRTSNPFGMTPPCDSYVPGYGDANADFHVIGDHPGVHGGAPGRSANGGVVHGGASDDAADGVDTSTGGPPTPEDDGASVGVPFTNEAGLRLQRALADAGLLESVGTRPELHRTFLSYLHMCVADRTPTGAEYREMERFFDAELRAIAAHVLMPVGERAIRHVLETYTAKARQVTDDVETLHATEIVGSGFLVMPIAEPAAWSDDHHERLVDGIERLRSTDFRRESDLGRFLAGDDPYFVR